MIDTNRDDTFKPLDHTGMVNTIEQEKTAAVQSSWSQRIWVALKSYPLPLGALVLLLGSLALWLAGYANLANWVLLVIVLLGGIPLLWETLKHFIHKEFSVDFIAILAITGSLFLGEYLAGAFIVLMLSGGEALEAYALRRARASLSALAERAPRTAHIWQREQLISIPAEDVEVGMEIVVKPGELIPVDGVVTSGSASISEADLTGEPLPIRKSTGMQVLSGSVNLDGVLQVRAGKRSAESKYAQIVRLVEEAQHQKAPIHRLADRYSVVFTVAAIALAGLSWALSGDSVYALAVLVVATPCPLILATPIAIMSGIDLAARNGIIAKSGAAIEQLGEVDVAVFDKTGTLTLGIPKVTAIVLPEQDHHIIAGEDLSDPQQGDHKGSPPGLTQGSVLQGLSMPVEAGAAGGGCGAPCGHPVWGTGILPSPSTPLAPCLKNLPVPAPSGRGGAFVTDYDENTLLRFAASVEQLSTHILARAVVEAALERDLPLSPAAEFEETFGKGVQGRVPIIAEDCQVERHSMNDFVAVAVGNRTFMQHLGIIIPVSLLSERKRRVDTGQICSFIAVDKQVAGLLVLEDIPRAELSHLSSDLKSAGLKETILRSLPHLATFSPLLEPFYKKAST